MTDKFELPTSEDTAEDLTIQIHFTAADARASSLLEKKNKRGQFQSLLRKYLLVVQAELNGAMSSAIKLGQFSTEFVMPTLVSYRESDQLEVRRIGRDRLIRALKELGFKVTLARGHALTLHIMWV
jgi:hypothetical protein